MSVNKDHQNNVSWGGALIYFFNHPWKFVIILLLIVMGFWVYFSILKPNKSINFCTKYTLVGKVEIPNGNPLEVEGLTIGVLGGPFTEDSKIINGTFRITSFALPKDEFIQVYIQLKNGKKVFIYKQPYDENRHLKNDEKCTLTFAESIIYNNKQSLRAEKSSEIKKLIPVIAIRTGNYQFLKDELIKKGCKISNSEPRYLIDVLHSGDIEKLNDNLYRYNGGNLRILVNDIECLTLPKYAINSTFEGGNNLDYVQQKINAQIKNLIQINGSDICSQILKCLE